MLVCGLGRSGPSSAGASSALMDDATRGEHRSFSPGNFTVLMVGDAEFWCSSTESWSSVLARCPARGSMTAARAAPTMHAVLRSTSPSCLDGLRGPEFRGPGLLPILVRFISPIGSNTSEVGLCRALGAVGSRYGDIQSSRTGARARVRRRGSSWAGRARLPSFEVPGSPEVSALDSRRRAGR